MKSHTKHVQANYDKVIEKLSKDQSFIRNKLVADRVEIQDSLVNKYEVAFF